MCLTCSPPGLPCPGFLWKGSQHGLTTLHQPSGRICHPDSNTANSAYAEARRGKAAPPPQPPCKELRKQGDFPYHRGRL